MHARAYAYVCMYVCVYVCMFLVMGGPVLELPFRTFFFPAGKGSQSIYILNLVIFLLFGALKLLKEFEF